MTIHIWEEFFSLLRTLKNGTTLSVCRQKEKNTISINSVCISTISSFWSFDFFFLFVWIFKKCTKKPPNGFLVWGATEQWLECRPCHIWKYQDLVTMVVTQVFLQIGYTMWPEVTQLVLDLHSLNICVDITRHQMTWI